MLLDSQKRGTTIHSLLWLILIEIRTKGAPDFGGFLVHGCKLHGGNDLRSKSKRETREEAIESGYLGVGVRGLEPAHHLLRYLIH